MIIHPLLVPGSREWGAIPLRPSGISNPLRGTFIFLWKKYHKTACTSIPEEEHLVVLNHVEDTIIDLKQSCKKCEFCWFVLRRYTTTHGSKNVKFTDPVLIGQGLSVGVRGKRMTKNHTDHVAALCLTKSDAVLSGRYWPTFQRNLLPLSSWNS
jgi:hypothetical protein